MIIEGFRPTEVHLLLFPPILAPAFLPLLHPHLLPPLTGRLEPCIGGPENISHHRKSTSSLPFFSSISLGLKDLSIVLGLGEIDPVLDAEELL